MEKPMTDFTRHIAEFDEEFVDPNNAGFFLETDKRQGDTYVWPPGVDRVSTEDAVYELFETALNEAEMEELAIELNGRAPEWARRSQV